MAEIMQISYPGPPKHGVSHVFDTTIDSQGVTWECTVAGKNDVGGTAQWVSAAAATTLDKFGAPVANVSFGGFNATLLGNAVNPGDAVPLSQAQGLFEPYDGGWGNQLTTGEETFSRLVTGAALANTTGKLMLIYFTARKTETINNIRMLTVGAATATPTLCRMGIYSVAANGALTLAGGCANDTTLFAAANTTYTRALTTPVNKVQGQRYALGVIVVSAAATPTFWGMSLVSLGGPEIAMAPMLTSVTTGQTDLTTPYTPSTATASQNALYGVVTP